jgi:hypothetical protein
VASIWHAGGPRLSQAPPTRCMNCINSFPYFIQYGGVAIDHIPDPSPSMEAKDGDTTRWQATPHARKQAQQGSMSNPQREKSTKSAVRTVACVPCCSALPGLSQLASPSSGLSSPQWQSTQGHTITMAPVVGQIQRIAALKLQAQSTANSEDLAKTTKEHTMQASAAERCGAVEA